MRELQEHGCIVFIYKNHKYITQIIIFIVSIFSCAGVPPSDIQDGQREGYSNEMLLQAQNCLI
jgi:hypothetical protein